MYNQCAYFFNVNPIVIFCCGSQKYIFLFIEMNVLDFSSIIVCFFRGFYGTKFYFWDNYDPFTYNVTTLTCKNLDLIMKFPI